MSVMRTPALSRAPAGLASASGGSCLAAAALLLGGIAFAAADDLRAREGYMSYNRPISRESGGNVPATQEESAAEPAQPGAAPDSEAEQAAAGPLAAEPGTAVAGPAASPGQVGVVAAAEPRVGQDQADAGTLRALAGKPLVNAAGEELGRIGAIVRDRQTGELKAVVSAGGFMGVGAREVTVPAAQLSEQGGQVVLESEMGPEELRQMGGYRAENFEVVAAPAERR